MPQRNSGRKSTLTKERMDLMNGIINIYKEKGYTSHDVVAKMRGILKIRKIGHTGTLDPDAEGVLPVCIGKATKVVDLIVEKDKTYEAVLKLGIMTDTQDMTGNVLATAEVDFDLCRIEEAARGFIGGYDQLPPMYSAIKVNGKKLYELARQGKEIERKTRRIEIRNIEILDYDRNEHEVRLRVDCGKGTYIRTLLHDIGAVLGCGGAMKSLIRTRVGSFNLSDALRLEQVKEYLLNNSIHEHIIPVDDMFLSYPGIIVDEKYNKRIYNGNIFNKEHLADRQNPQDMAALKAGMQGGCVDVRVYDSEGTFAGIYRYDDTGIFTARKMFL